MSTYTWLIRSWRGRCSVLSLVAFVLLSGLASVFLERLPVCGRAVAGESVGAETSRKLLVSQSASKRSGKKKPPPAPEFKEGDVTEDVCKGCLVVLEDALPLTLSPLNAITLIDQRTQALIHDGLFNLGDAGMINSSLIEIGTDGLPRYSSTQDKRAAEGWIKPNALFHDGRPVTADDLKGTLLAYAAASNKGMIATRAYAGLFKSLELGAREPLRNFTVSFVRPQQETKVPLSVRLLPRHGFENPEDPADWPSDANFFRQPVGTGPFRVLSRGLGASRTQLTLAQFPKYHKGAPMLPGIQVVAQPSMTAKIQALRTRSAHVLVSINKADKSLLPDSSVTIPYFIRNWWHVGMNLSHPLLKEAQARKAIALALNRAQLGRQLADKVDIAGGVGGSSAGASLAVPSDEASQGADPSVVLISGPFVPESAYYNNKVAHPEFDPDGARALLKQIKGVSIDLSGANAVLKYNGVPVSLSFGVRNDIPGATDVMVGIQSQLAYLGIRLDLYELSPQDFLARVPTVRSPGRLDMFLSRYNFDEYDDIRPIFHSAGALNFFRYADRETDQLFDKAAASATYEEEVSVMQALHAKLANDLPCIFLWEAAQVAAFDNTVRGYKLHSYSFYVNPHKWYIDNSRRKAVAEGKK